MNKGCGYDLTVRAQNRNSLSLEKLTTPQLVICAHLSFVILKIFKENSVSYQAALDDD